MDDTSLSYLILGLLSALCLFGMFFPRRAFHAYIILAAVETVYLSVAWAGYQDSRYTPWQPYVIFIFVGFLMTRLGRKGSLEERTPLDGIIWIIVFFELLALLWARKPAMNFAYYANFTLFTHVLSYFLFTQYVNNLDELKRVTNLWIVASVIGAISIFGNTEFDYEQRIFITREMNIHLAYTSLYGRPGGISGPSHLSGYLSLGVFFLVNLIVLTKVTWKRWWYLSLIVFMGMAVVAGQTRAVFITLIAGTLFYVWFSPYVKGRRIASALFGIFLVFGCMAIYSPEFINRILIGFGYSGELFLEDSSRSYSYAAGGSEPEGQSGTAIRFWWWGNTLAAMAERPESFLIGLGPGGVQYYSQGSPEANAVMMGFFLDLGLVGMILFSLMFFVIITNIRWCIVYGKGVPSYPYFLVVLTGFVIEPGIHGLVDYDLNSYGAKNFWMPFALLMATMNILKKEVKALEGQGAGGDAVSDVVPVLGKGSGPVPGVQGNHLPSG